MLYLQLMSIRHASSAGFSAISLIVALGFALVLGVSVLYVSKNSNSSAAPFSILTGHRSARISPENLTYGELTSTMPDIIEHGQDLECDWKIPPDGTNNVFTSGKLWTSDNRGRSTIAADRNGMNIEANMIFQKNTAYAWLIADGQKTGMRIHPSSLNEENRSMTADERQQAEQVRASILFNCQSWTADESKFILPSDVEFPER
jgi:hypothetical protein